MANKEVAFNVYTSTPYEKDGESKNFYTKVGAAFAHSKGGFSIRLNALPVNGELVLFPPSEKEPE